MQIFDTHAHYDDDKFDADRYELLDKIKDRNISLIVNAASDMDSAKKSIELAKKYDFIYAAVGVHPHSASEGIDKNKLIEMLKEKKVVAIGEIGLDYFYDNSPRELQKKVYREQLEIARSLDMPVIIHDREAHEDSLKPLLEMNDVKGVFHCFSGSVEMAKQVIDLGMYISFGGTITFKNARKSIEVIKSIPIDKILIETDSPYLSPEPRRGRRNDSSSLIYIIDKIAQILDLSPEKVAEISFENGKKLFRI